MNVVKIFEPPAPPPPLVLLPFEPPAELVELPEPDVELPEPDPAPVGTALEVVVKVAPWLSVVVITTPPGTSPPIVEVVLPPAELDPVATRRVVVPEEREVSVAVTVAVEDWASSASKLMLAVGELIPPQ